MCDLPEQVGAPSSVPGATTAVTVTGALELVVSGLGWLASADLTTVPVAVRADCLRTLEQVRSIYTAAHASVLSAFDQDNGYAADGQGTARTWLRWQTQTTSAAASAAVAWMRRLRDHRGIADAMKAGRITESWGKQICEWTDRLPESARPAADDILLTAAASGAELADLARLVEQLRQRLATPDKDDDGFDDRRLRLATTLGGAGRLDGDLTPQCAQAFQAVLEALGKKAGPEDNRTLGQRHHDALAEACRRLIAAGGLPDRAGQPTQIQLHITLEDLLARLEPGQGRPVVPLRSSGPAAGPTFPGWPSAGPGDECDASIVPIVTGCLDHELLARLTDLLTSGGRPGDLSADGTALIALKHDSIRDLIVANAAALFTGPRGLASWLRTRTLPGAAGSVSLPLDTGTSTETIPPHLRRAVINRDRHCAAPGCDVPPSGCQVHHLHPRSLGGLTKLSNLILLCTFHHLIAVHRWGWTLALNADGTTTMTSPDGSRSYRSHSPPVAA
jgi:Domain of unknown function (DUF222)